jgi:tetratricopeptide (TPR) repeat protein
MKRLIFILCGLVMIPVLLQAGMELTSARVYRKQGDFDKALEWYDKAIAADSTSVVAYFEKGELLGQMADEQNKPELFVEMRKAFDAILNLADTEPKQVQKYRPKMDNIIEKYWVFQYNEAVAKFRLADNDSALDATAARLAGDKWATMSGAERDSLRKVTKNNYWKQSQKILQRAMIINPERWESYALMQNIQSLMHDWVAAEASLHTAIEKHVKPSEAAGKRSRIQQTESEWRRSHLDMLENLAQITYELKQYQRTVDVCKEIFALDPQDLPATKLIAFSYNQMREKTLDAYEKATAAHAENADSLSNAANQLRDEAIEAYRKALAAQPDNTDLLYNAAQLYLQMGDTAKAIQSLADFVALDSTDFEVVFQLGVIYLEGGSFADNEKAKEIFGNATKTFPNNPVVWTNYGVALIRAGDTVEGRKAIEKAKELKGE